LQIFLKNRKIFKIQIWKERSKKLHNKLCEQFDKSWRK